VTPFHLACTPSTNCAHLSVDYENTFANYTNFSIDCAYNFEDYANTLDDRANIVADLLSLAFNWKFHQVMTN
jgi:hypothetical protein